jgi:hypothetical protein
MLDSVPQEIIQLNKVLLLSEAELRSCITGEAV